MIKKGQLVKIRRPGTSEFTHVGKVLVSQKKDSCLVIKNLITGEIENTWECFVEQVEGEDRIMEFHDVDQFYR
jgi:predicted ATP-grasp superfamily ATP-dependent carboligase